MNDTNALFKPVTALKGVGEKRKELYAKLGVETIYDLLFHLPRSYIDFTSPVSPPEAETDEYAVLRGVIEKKNREIRTRTGLSIFKAVASDGIYDFTVTIFNAAYAFNCLKEGEEYCFYGKVTGSPLNREIVSPKIVRTDEELIQPVYHLTTGLTAGAVLYNVREALSILDAEPFDTTPDHLLMENELFTLPHALRAIHFPKNMEEAHSARRRLAFDELLILQLGLTEMKKKRVQSVCKPMSEVDMTPFFESLPFEMTNAQKRGVWEIIKDLSMPYPMNRLLQGDVGSGKTAVAAAACYYTFKNNRQSAVMAPTEILAVQHYNTFRKFLEPCGMTVALLTGSMTVKQKNAVKKSLASGETAVVIGTHAIIQKGVEFENLSLVITDEQHRFGVAQRERLAEKGDSPHKLVMSATPIPRTLALIIYGDLDISVIDESPKGRLPVKTYAVTGALRERIFSFIIKEIESGGRAYIVCPMIEDSDSDLQAVTSYAKNVSKKYFKKYSVGLLHGKMKAADKTKVMEDFKKGDVQILVCTTVVEVGVDVPEANVMLIENAERFGLSQLHQLRGRVGRGTRQSHCILLTDNKSDECLERMKIMSSSSDGFKISEEDLRLRGPGDFFGDRQHGLPPLKITDMAADMDMVAITGQAAQDILRDDPQLEKPEHSGLRMEIIRLFNRNHDEE